MNPERLRQIEELYHAAREFEPDQRQAFLSKACGTDAEMLREVASLLDQHNSGGPLGQPVLSVAADLLGEDRFEAGSRVGPYDIVGRIGEGGMGAVYRAHDTRLGRTIAIKVAYQEFSGRSQREARAIASLNHPTSARCTTSGRTIW
jgi:serine/threonine protein kinase